MKSFLGKRKIVKIVSILACCVVSANVLAAELNASAGGVDDRSDLEVTANVKNAEVYINSNYQGKTPLLLTDLLPLTYNVTVKKDGYSSEEFSVQLQRGMKHTYNVQLKESRGTITFTGVMPGSFIYIDGELYKSQPMEVRAGQHEVNVRKFGYSDQKFSVTVTDKSTTNLAVSMREAQFSLSNFSVSRKSINPQTRSNLGVCTFKFSVTAAADGIFTISDAAGNEVYREDIPTFQTWDHSIRWNGTRTDGLILPSGTYVARISAGGQTRTTQIEVNYTLVHSTNDFTTGGTGIGVVGTATAVPEKTMFFHGGVAPTFDFGKNKVADVPVLISIGYAPVSWLEVSAFADIQTVDSAALLLSGAVKAVKKIPVSRSGDASVNLAALFHYGGLAISGDRARATGYNSGAGLNAGGSLGYENKMVYAGITSEYAVGVATGNISVGDSVWRNALTVKYQVTPNLSLHAWGALHSAFKIYDAAAETASGETNFARAIDAGLSAAAILGNSSFMLNVGANVTVFFKEYTTLGVNVGIAYWM